MEIENIPSNSAASLAWLSAVCQNFLSPTIKDSGECRESLRLSV